MSKSDTTLLEAIQQLTAKNIEVRFQADSFLDAIRVRCIEHFGRDYRYEHMQIFDMSRLLASGYPEMWVTHHLLDIAKNWKELKDLAVGREEQAAK